VLSRRQKADCQNAACNIHDGWVEVVMESSSLTNTWFGDVRLHLQRDWVNRWASEWPWTTENRVGLDLPAPFRFVQTGAKGLKQIVVRERFVEKEGSLCTCRRGLCTGGAIKYSRSPITTCAHASPRSSQRRLPRGQQHRGLQVGVAAGAGALAGSRGPTRSRSGALLSERARRGRVAHLQCTGGVRRVQRRLGGGGEGRRLLLGDQRWGRSGYTGTRLPLPLALLRGAHGMPHLEQFVWGGVGGDGVGGGEGVHRGQYRPGAHRAILSRAREVTDERESAVAASKQLPSGLRSMYVQLWIGLSCPSGMHMSIAAR